MSEGIENNIKQTFEDSITVKQKVIDEGAYKVLLDAGNVIAESISKKGLIESSSLLQLTINKATDNTNKFLNDVMSLFFY